MIRIKDIQRELRGLLGWKQTFGDKHIYKELTESSSGQYFQGFHPLLALENLRSIAPNFDKMPTPAWSEESRYQEGDVVKFEGKMYKNTGASSGVSPTGTSTGWREYDPFSEWLIFKTDEVIAAMANKFYSDKLAIGSSRSVFENRALFDGAGRIYDTQKNSKSVVGMEIIPIRSKGVTVKVDKIGLQFTQPGKINIYIMHSSRRDPVKKLTFNRVREGSMEWFYPEDLYLPYLSDENDAGGSWYIVYDQRELEHGNEAVIKNKDWSKGPCGGCNSNENRSHRLLSMYMEVHPFKTIVDLGDFSDDFNDDFYRQSMNMWDVEDTVYTKDSNHGINLVLSAHCDMTDFIIEQKHTFTELLGLQMAESMLLELAYNPNTRINRSAENNHYQRIMYELSGGDHPSTGLSYKLKGAYKAMEISTRGLSRICLPCNKKGIKFKTV